MILLSGSNDRAAALVAEEARCRHRSLALLAVHLARLRWRCPWRFGDGHRTYLVGSEPHHLLVHPEFLAAAPTVSTPRRRAAHGCIWRRGNGGHARPRFDGVGGRRRRWCFRSGRRAPLVDGESSHLLVHPKLLPAALAVPAPRRKADGVRIRGQGGARIARRACCFDSRPNRRGECRTRRASSFGGNRFKHTVLLFLSTCYPADDKNGQNRRHNVYPITNEIANAARLEHLEVLRIAEERTEQDPADDA